MKAIIQNSKTFDDYKEDARVLVWMATRESNKEAWCFNGQNAHIQSIFKQEYPNIVAMCLDRIKRAPILKTIDFYELNDLGIKVVGLCVESKNQESLMESTQSACCCKSNNLLMSKELFRIPYVKFTYSTRLLVNSFFINPKGDYWFLKANLFDKRNFAIIKEPDLKKPIDKKHIHHAFESETCIGCHVDFDLNKIQKHLAHMEECKNTYNCKELRDLENKIAASKRIHKNQKYHQHKNTTVSDKKEHKDSDDDVICKGCEAPFGLHIIKKHLANKPDCHASYDLTDLKNLEQNVENYKKMNKKQYNKEYYFKSGKDMKSDLNQEKIQCDGCGHYFKVSGIRMHIKSKCSDAYNEETLKKLNERLKFHASQVKKISNAANYKRNRDSIEKKVGDFVHSEEKKIPYEFCLSCKKPFEISKILKHVSHIKECYDKYSNEAFHALKAKCEKAKKENKRNQRRNLSESSKNVKANEGIEKKNTPMSEEQTKKYLEKVEEYKKYREKNARYTNDFQRNFLLERMERVVWKNHSKAIKTEFSTMMQEIKLLDNDLVNAIDKAALEVKDLDDYKPVAEKFDPLQGGIGIIVKKNGWKTIYDHWKELNIKFCRRLQAIADEIQQPFECFICPSKDRLCEDCKVRKGQNQT